MARTPSPDTLPGDTAPVSAEIAGKRAAAIARLGEASRLPLVVVLGAEAVARPLPKVAEALTLAVGDTFDAEAFTVLLEARSYFADDRVDDAGEYALRTVLDVFPAASAQPVRIEFDDAQVIAIRCYGPVSQLGDRDIDRIDFASASETASDRTIFDLLPDARVAIEVGVERQAARIAALAKDIGDRAVAEVLAPDAWKQATAARQGRNRGARRNF